MKKHKYDNIEEEMYSYNIEGLNVYIIPKPFFQKKSASLCVRFGSKDLCFNINDEGFKTYPEGIAHFLEHKVFESEEGNSFEKFSSLGARVNAFTNSNVTNYYFSTIDNFEKCLEELFYMVMNPFFTEENVQKEKGIIEQEIKMYEDDPFNKLYYANLEGMYTKLPVYKDIAGTVESIYKITPKMLQENFDAFYRFDNMDFVVVGDVDNEEIIGMVEKIVSKKRNEIKVETLKYDEPNEILYNEKEIELNLKMNRFLLTFKDTAPKDEKEMIKRDVIMDFVKYKYFSRSSNLYQSMYIDGIINENFQSSYNLYNEYCFYVIYGESRDTKAAKEKIISEVVDDKNLNISDIEFDKIKKILIGKFFESFNSIDGLGYNMANYCSRGINFFDYYNEVINVNKEDIVKNIKRLFTTEKSVFVSSK